MIACGRRPARSSTATFCRASMKDDRISEPEQDALRDLLAAAALAGLPLVAVVASARELVFDREYGIRPHRTTTDWDFGIRVGWPAFFALRAEAAAGGLFSPAAAREHRLVHVASSVSIDLIPFGELERDGRITWPTTGHDMDVTGYRDAYETAPVLHIAPGLRLRVATVPHLVALKV